MKLFTRRGFVGLASSWLLSSVGSRAFAWAGRDFQTSPKKWADAPGPESADVAARIDHVAEQLHNGASPSEILCDQFLMDLHPYSRFKELVKSHATSKPVSLCSLEEPGERAVLKIEVVSKTGTPQAGALVYVYHTTSAGWYAEKGYHVRAESGDQRHARLFGYGRTNKNGFLEVQTIRPAGYPDGNLPAHYHVKVLEPTTVVTEIQFSDDPRLTPAALEQSRRDGFAVS
ncbi:MAG: hypothetical protein ACKVQS_11660 [Fimbriimonadaceae bacterium]